MLKPKKIFYLFLFLLSNIQLYSQNNESNFVLQFENDTINIKKTKLIQTSLFLRNTGTEPISGELNLFSESEDLSLIKKIHQTIKLEPNEFIYIPIKAQLKPKTFSSKMFIKASFETKNETYSKTLAVLPEKTRNVQLNITNQQFTFLQVNDSITLGFNIMNKGNTDQVVHLVIKYPLELSKKEFETFEINTKAFQDTTFYVEKIVNKQMLKREDFEIQASLYYKSGDFINSYPIFINSIKENRVYRDSNYDDYRYQENEIRFNNSYNTSSNQNNLNLGINSQIKLSESENLRLNTQMEYWDTSKKYFLRNTVIGYKNKNIEANIGNLFQQGEVMINGMGAELKYKLTDSLNFEVGFVDKSYSALETFKYSNGYSGWLALNSIKQNNTLTRTFLNYDVDYNTGISKYILFHSQDFIVNNNFKIGYQQGLSVMNDNENIASGIIGGISGLYTSENWSYYGNHIISSNQYAGMRRGVFQINERIQYKIKKHNFSFFYNYNQLNPDGLNAYEAFFNNQINQSINLGYRFSNSTYSFNVSPIYTNEKRINSYFSSINSFKKIGINTVFQINNFKRDLILNTGFDMGKILTLKLQEPFSYRFVLSLKYKQFNLSTQYQYNYNNINEIVRPEELNKTYKNLSTSLMYTFNMLNNKLEFSTYINYALNNSFANLIVVNNTLRYEIDKNFKVFLNSNYNKYLDGLEYSNLNLQAGLIKNFDPNKVRAEKANLTIAVKYNEKNKTTKNADRKIVYINNKPFITDTNGKVSYKKIPHGTYEIRLQNDKEWLSEAVTIKIDKDTSYEMLYNKTATINGYLDFEESKNSYEIKKDKGGFRIDVKNAAGKIYKTYTDDSGRYIIYVPEGIYTISLYNHLSDSQTEIKNNNLEITTSIDTPINQNFIINIKEKKTEIKKFNPVKF